jgi:putative oxidoreductase
MNWIFQRSPWSDRALALLRIVAGAIFMSYGTMKLFGYPPSPTPMPAFALTSQLGIAGLLETFGGLAIVLGLLTRPVAFVLAGEMAVAYFQAHAPHSFYPVVNNGVPAVLYCFLFLYLAVAGAGAWSIDRLLLRGTALNDSPMWPETEGNRSDRQRVA